jgi:hypothetical protein
VEWAEAALDPGALVVSDRLTCFVAAADLVGGQERVVVGPRKSSDLDCFRWVNILLGNIKSSIQGTYHGFKFNEYAARYLAGLQYRSKRRFDLPSVLPHLLLACAVTPARPEKWLLTVEARG